MDSFNSNTNYSTLLLMVLKERRLQYNFHQGHIAQTISKTPSAWAKIESGQATLSSDIFWGACLALNISPSDISKLVESLIPTFNMYGFYFHAGTLNIDEDDLLKLINNFYNSSGYQEIKNTNNFITIENHANWSLMTGTKGATIVRYCCEPDYRKWIDNGANGTYQEHIIGFGY